MQKQNRAGTAAVLRGAVAAYLGYLGYMIITNKDTSMKPLTAKLTGGALIAAAAAFCVYTVIRFRADSRAAAEHAGSEAPQDKGADT